MGILIIVSNKKTLCNSVVISYNPSKTTQPTGVESQRYMRNNISSSLEIRFFQVTGPVIRQGPETAGPIFSFGRKQRYPFPCGSIILW